VGGLALLLALESRRNVWQANVPMFEAPNLSGGIVHKQWREFEARHFLTTQKVFEKLKHTFTLNPAIGYAFCWRLLHSLSLFISQL
jgi:hypothetical protein